MSITKDIIDNALWNWSGITIINKQVEMKILPWKINMAVKFNDKIVPIWLENIVQVFAGENKINFVANFCSTQCTTEDIESSAVD